MNIVLLGLPGSGKGTVSAHITAGSGKDPRLAGEWTEFDAGTELRKYAYGGDLPEQVNLRELLETGYLAATDLMMRIYREWVTRTAASGSHILSSGIPRGDQVGFFLEDVGRGAYGCDGALFLDAPDEVLVERLAGRRTCADCGDIYHVTMRPPRVGGHCDACTSPLAVRPEDGDVDVMRKRIANNRTKVLEAWEALQVGGIRTRTIDATRSPDLVYASVAHEISQLSNPRAPRPRGRERASLR